MKIAFTAAHSMEFITFRRYMGRVQKLPLGTWQHYLWQHNGDQVILLETGIGPEKAYGALTALLQVYKIDCIINFPTLKGITCYTIFNQFSYTTYF